MGQTDNPSGDDAAQRTLAALRALHDRPQPPVPWRDGGNLPWDDPVFSERMLAQTLQLLEADGFVARRAYPVVPPHVEYSLTPLGEEVAEKVRLLADWIEVNFHRGAESRRNAKRQDKPAAAPR